MINIGCTRFDSTLPMNNDEQYMQYLFWQFLYYTKCINIFRTGTKARNKLQTVIRAKMI